MNKILLGFLLACVALYVAIYHYTQSFAARSFDVLEKTIAASGQFIVLGDTDHEDIRLRYLFSDERIMAAFAKAGVKVVVLEVRAEFQGDIDALASGKISKAEYISRRIGYYDAMKEFDPALREKTLKRITIGADMMINAQRHGIRVIAAEKEFGSVGSHYTMAFKFLDGIEAFYKTSYATRAATLSKTQRALEKYAFEASMYTGGLIALDTMQRIIADNLTPAVTSSATQNPALFKYVLERKEILEQRLREDMHLARFIKEQAKGKKTVIFYGVFHGAHECDLDDYLKANRLELYSTPHEAMANRQRNYMLGVGMGDALIVNTGTVLKAADYKTTILPDAPVMQESGRPQLCIY